MNFSEDKYRILKQYFGYDSFRDGQETLIDGILNGRDVLGIMPTGAGKSLCFQVPALLLPGITLVVSPLISLMKDQVRALNQAGVHAAFLNSSLTASQYYKAMDLARTGRYKIIYVAPERLLTEEFLEFALQAEISMVAVDEAHCVSQWGQDFRPSYLKVTEFIERFEERPVVCAFTATATKQVKEDMVHILKLQNPVCVSTGFDRANLYFEVSREKDRYGRIREYLNGHPGQSGIIYCLTRKIVDEVYGQLSAERVLAARYHAGMADGDRRKNQEDFTYDRAQVMVATNAFGMGIDKSNIRFVIHYGMPKNIENYYQEAGRAGRDGEPAECILLYSGQDVITNQFFIENNQDNHELDSAERAVVMERDRERLKKMTYYCFTNECLRDYILRYFGEYGANFCNNCSNCLNQFEEVDVTGLTRGLIGCVESSRQRYGATVIIETLRGADTAKIRRYRMNENPHYGEFSKEPVYKLRQVLNHLLLNGYLAATNDEYAIVKLTEKSAEVLEKGEPVVMKMAKEQERSIKPERDKKGTKKALAGAELTEGERKLFEELRALRSEIAKEEGMPPYIVFSDKTLVHMSRIKPLTKDEMLTVTGVGAFKYEKYGERFIACVRQGLERLGISRKGEPASEYEDGFGRMGDEWHPDDEVLFINSFEMDDEIDKGKVGAPRHKGAKKTKEEFAMTDELAGRIHYSPKATLSEFVGQMNDLRDEGTMKRLTIKSVEEMLIGDGILEERFVNGMKRKRLTERGEAFGIEIEMRTSEKGNEYEVFFYNERAQRAVVERLLNKNINDYTMPTRL